MSEKGRGRGGRNARESGRGNVSGNVRGRASDKGKGRRLSSLWVLLTILKVCFFQVKFRISYDDIANNNSY